MIDLTVSDQFKSMATKSILSIVFFVFVYTVLILLATVLTFICGYGGLLLIITKPMLITIVLGIGLASVGVLILIFLIKFIFKKHKTDRTHLIEITRCQEPKLFQMIDQIVSEVETNYPKKVYLSADVNAAVFYDSSLWSMFFPIKKNLVIGMGLVNAITEEELKSILSHEFGHFSQRTMKVGSYVYNVNQIIFNMLFDNDSYDNLITKWGNVSGYFSIFGAIAFKIISGIQWILKEVYEVVNLNYMGLSREMEFQADEIAANITGHKPLVTSLYRMDFVEYAYGSVLNFYDGKINDNLKSSNIYKEQIFTLGFLAKENELSIENNLPQVSLEDMNKFNKSKLIIEDQWASHPSIEERKIALEKLEISPKSETNNSANDLFTNIEETQIKLTEKVFDAVQYEGKLEQISSMISNLGLYRNTMKMDSINYIMGITTIRIHFNLK